MKVILPGTDLLIDADGTVLVCARCHSPLARGMSVVVYPAALYRRYLELENRPVPFDLDDAAVLVCRPCSLAIDAADMRVH